MFFKSRNANFGPVASFVTLSLLHSALSVLIPGEYLDV